MTYLKKQSKKLNFVKTRSTYSNAGPVLRWEAAVKGRLQQTQPHPGSENSSYTQTLTFKLMFTDLLLPSLDSEYSSGRRT